MKVEASASRNSAIDCIQVGLVASQSAQSGVSRSSWSKRVSAALRRKSDQITTMIDQPIEDAEIVRYGSKMLTGIQIAAARALLGITAEELSDRAGVSLSTIKRAEGAAGNTPGVNVRNLGKIERALEIAGVVFLSAGQLLGGGVGVRLKS
jgi:hypothetical protein